MGALIWPGGLLVGQAWEQQQPQLVQVAADLPAAAAQSTFYRWDYRFCCGGNPPANTITHIPYAGGAITRQSATWGGWFGVVVSGSQ